LALVETYCEFRVPRPSEKIVHPEVFQATSPQVKPELPDLMEETDGNLLDRGSTRRSCPRAKLISGGR